MTHDPSLNGALVMRRTSCRHGGHVFTYASYGIGSRAEEPQPDRRCDCGLYTWAEWGKVTG